MIAAGFDSSGPSRKPVVGEGAGQVARPARAGKVRSSVFEPADAMSVPAQTNGATVKIGGPDDGGISDDDVDVPPFMRH